MSINFRNLRFVFGRRLLEDAAFLFLAALAFDSFGEARHRVNHCVRERLTRLRNAFFLLMRFAQKQYFFSSKIVDGLAARNYIREWLQGDNPCF
ncbi:MAG: hypothetical protein II561_05225 [Thermoguttaceae bacterium]|nr:hypothetical protein [Thermoguttaceae bacterium]